MNKQANSKLRQLKKTQQQKLNVFHINETMVNEKIMQKRLER